MLSSLILAAMVSGAAPLLAEDSCYDRSVAVTKMVSNEPDKVLEIVEREVAATPLCSCEIVKAAIETTEADRDLVAQIVATAIGAAPEKMRIIAQCAVAVAPDALPNVMKVLAALDPNKGEGYSEKGVMEKGGLDKGKEVAVAPMLPSPLDGPYLVPGEPPLHPNFFTPEDITDAGGFGSGKKGNGDYPYERGYSLAQD